MLDTRRVLLLIETSKSYGRALLEGIGRYVEAHGRWSLYVEERGLSDPQPAWLRRWQGDGIIFRSYSPALVQAVNTCGVPAVDTNSRISGHGFPLVYTDEVAVAEAAVAHFRDRRFERFAFCAIEDEPWVRLRREAYLAELARLGLACDCLYVPTGNARSGWERQQRQMAEWVTGLPKPVAILAANDVAGMRLLDACNSADVAVPEQAAVLGVDNDEILNKLASPPMSSIDLDAIRIGYQAAALLGRLMHGDAPPDEPIFLPPAGVITRKSTDITAVQDPELAAALMFIRRHACDGITVHEVVRHVSISRATLERRFADQLHRSPYEEISRVRMEHVQRMLAMTDYTLDDIARQTGFRTASHLSTAFKHRTGQSPSDFRSRREIP